MNEPQYLYHYTSLETLALILENKTLAFNSLKNVDDIQEADTADVKDFGKYMYVSCWTDTERESIPMWNMYTPNMQGVRIKLSRFPFKKYHYEPGQFNFKEPADSYIDFEKTYKEYEYMVNAAYPELIPITYTDDEELLFPKVRTCSEEEMQRYLALEDMSGGNVSVGYRPTPVGRYKSKDWSFQHEWRYRLFLLPQSIKKLKYGSFAEQQEIFRRMENPNTPLPCERFFLDLDPNSLTQMEIVLGPRMTDANRILARALLKEHGLLQNCRSSSLLIR